jgi:hypothetical protein
MMSFKPTLHGLTEDAATSSENRFVKSGANGPLSHGILISLLRKMLNAVATPICETCEEIAALTSSDSS